MLKNLFLLILLFYLVGCALNTTSKKIYLGEQRQKSEIATIDSWGESRYSPLGGLVVHPMTIDEIEINPSRNYGKIVSYSILPGEHKIKSILFWNIGFNMIKIIDPIEMTFNAKAGHLYTTKAYAPREFSKEVLIAFWIEDVDTGEVVAGNRPSIDKYNK